MPVLMASALFEEDSRLLLARRRPGRPPFAGQWLLPSTVVRPEETAEEALARHLREELGMTPGALEFVATPDLGEAAGGETHVTNVFRPTQYSGRLRFRAGGDYEDVRWLAAAELADLPMPSPMKQWLLMLLRPTGQGPAPPPDGELTYAERKRRLYAEYAQSYDEDRRLLVGEQELARRTAFLVERLRPGQRVLDAGCGTGIHLRAIAEAVGRQGACVGMDISPEMLAVARRRVVLDRNVVLRLCDLAHGIPLEDACLDTVVTSNLVQELPDPTLFFAEARRVLRPGGQLTAIIACYEGDGPAERAHAEVSARCGFFFRPYDQALAAVRAAGLALRSAEYAPSAARQVAAEDRPRFRLFARIADEVRAGGFDPAQVRMGVAMIRAQREG